MARELIQVDARKRPIRIALILLILVAALWSFYAFRWYIGNTMAEYFNTGENNLDLAQISRNLAPEDPLTHWRLAQVSQKRLPLDQSAVALAEYERAVALSPNDYRFWMSLGTAREQAGDVAAAEPALRQSVALAPSYAYPHWYLGNLLLRSARYDEAFTELRKASDAAPDDLRPQLFNLIWQVYGGDFGSLKKAVGDSAEARAQFALYLISQSKIDEGVGIWNSLRLEDKKANKETGDSIIKSLVGASRFHDAVKLWNDLATTSAYHVELGRITDGGFEEIISYGPETIFGWQVKTSPQMEIGIDPNVSHSGDRSLRFVFQIRTKLDTVIASQLIPVASNTTYDFQCFVRTAKLQTGGPPVIQIVEAKTGVVLATSEAAPNGDNEWKPLAMTFKTGESTEAVILKVVRASCDESTVCPIFGSVWYDDFSLNGHN